MPALGNCGARPSAHRRPASQLAGSLTQAANTSCRQDEASAIRPAIIWPNHSGCRTIKTPEARDLPSTNATFCQQHRAHSSHLLRALPSSSSALPAHVRSLLQNAESARCRRDSETNCHWRLIRKPQLLQSESAQSRLVLAFVSAAFAVLMTTGHGLTYLTALFETLTDNTLLVQWSLLVSIMGLMVVVSLPLEWLIRYRLRERFGYQRRSRKEWFKRTVGISTAGLAAALPATALLLILCEVTGPYWWLLVWMLYLAWLFWRWRLSLMRGKLWSRASRPIKMKPCAARSVRCSQRRAFAWRIWSS